MKLSDYTLFENEKDGHGRCWLRMAQLTRSMAKLVHSLDREFSASLVCYVRVRRTAGYPAPTFVTLHHILRLATFPMFARTGFRVPNQAALFHRVRFGRFELVRSLYVRLTCAIPRAIITEWQRLYGCSSFIYQDQLYGLAGTSNGGDVREDTRSFMRRMLVTDGL